MMRVLQITLRVLLTPIFAILTIVLLVFSACLVGPLFVLVSVAADGSLDGLEMRETLWEFPTSILRALWGGKA